MQANFATFCAKITLLLTSNAEIFGTSWRPWYTVVYVHDGNDSEMSMSVGNCFQQSNLMVVTYCLEKPEILCCQEAIHNLDTKK
jgi:hypothetical protein